MADTNEPEQLPPGMEYLQLPDVKPGTQTSEFWVAIATKLIMLAVSAGVLTESWGQEFSKAITPAITGVFALLALAHVARGYIQSRATVKAAHAASISGLINQAGGGTTAATMAMACLVGLLAFGSPAHAQPYTWTPALAQYATHSQDLVRLRLTAGQLHR
jgi:hypothetical protein